MTLDVRGSLKNTKINKNHYVVIDELLSNSIDSYLIRKVSDDAVTGLQVDFFIEFHKKDLFEEDSLDLKVICKDNGAGLGDNETKAFVTKDTSYKDDLGIIGIGKCKGSGRIQFFHYFSKIEVDSIYVSDGVYKRRSLRADDSVKEISEESFSVDNTQENDTRTTITLDLLKDNVYQSLLLNKDIKKLFSSISIKHHVIVSFLQRLVGLKESLGDFCLTFKTKYGEDEHIDTITPSDIPEVTEIVDTKIYYSIRDSDAEMKPEEFKISHYRLPSSEYDLDSNVVALCAKSSIVKLISKTFLRTNTIANNPINGYYHIILIESDCLNDYVNEQRDDFNIPDDPDHIESFLERRISYQEIIDGIEEHIIKMLSPPEWDKDAIVKSIGDMYGVSSTMISETSVRIRYGDTEEAVVERVLKKYQEVIIKDTTDIFNLRTEISASDPNSDTFREKIDELAWKYTSSAKKIDMANLSQLVVRRAAILEILSMAIHKRLDIQQNTNGKREENEKIIHNIFFPMRRDSTEINDHDIWVLSEEYQYFDYIASDKPLSQITWDGGETLFSNDIDDELSEILKRNYEGNSAKRPDIAIFSKEGAAIIIEFKAPGVELNEHTGDLMEYAQLLAAKSNRKLRKFYGYLIGDKINPNRLRGYTRFPSDKGWFNTEGITEHTTGQNLGELYSELLFYDDIVDRAKDRLNVYKERLNLTIE